MARLLVPSNGVQSRVNPFAGAPRHRTPWRGWAVCGWFGDAWPRGMRSPGRGRRVVCPPSVRGHRGSGRVFARRGHRRCLYPAAREHSGPVGGSAVLVGPRPPPGGWVRGCRRTVRRAVCPPGGAIDVVYTPAAREHTGRGNGAARGAGSRVGVVGRVPSSLRVVRGGRLGPVGRVLLPFLVRPVGGAAGVRRGPAGPGGSGLLVSLSVRWAGLPGSAPVGRARRDCWGCGPGPPPFPCPSGGRARAGRVGVVGCGVSGRLVRRRCRSGRCAGGTRGRGRTSRWW